MVKTQKWNKILYHCSEDLTLLVTLRMDCLQKMRSKVNKTSQCDLQQAWFENMMQEIESQISKFKTDPQDMKNPKIRTSCAHLNDQGTLTETTKATTSSNWLSILDSEWSWDSTLHQCEFFGAPQRLSPAAATWSLGCWQVRRALNTTTVGETKRQKQMMVSLKKMWYLTYPPGNSQTFKSIKVLFKRTFLCLTLTTDSFTLKKTEEKNLTYWQRKVLDVLARDRDIIKPCYNGWGIETMASVQYNEKNYQNLMDEKPPIPP